MVRMMDVAVIGAGSAGIAAARFLAAAGLAVRLLEARGRVGGRACTDVATLGVPADLGAAWLHFADESPWTQLARDQGLHVIECNPDWGARSHIGGRRPTAAEVADAEAAYARSWTCVGRAAEAGLDVPVSDLLPSDPFRPRFDAVMTWIMGVESRETSSLDLARYADSARDWAVAEGIGTVVAGAAIGLDVTLDAAVTAIDHDGNGVRITTSRGTLDARAAIVTVPTSLLARGDIRFTPDLPTTHQRALADVPLGSNNKVFFRFDEADLPLDGPGHCLVRADTSRTVHFGIRPAGQPLAMAYFGGNLSRELEAQGALESFAREALGQTFGTALPNRIRRTLSTSWDGDRWAGGSYTAARPGAARQREVLASPISPRLLLAGEACHPHHYGTIYGAWQSGVAAARHVIDTLRSPP
ncbi:MAG: hypothetical protein RLZZ393_2006 [Pseudomonadota bacterium]